MERDCARGLHEIKYFGQRLDSMRRESFVSCVSKNQVLLHARKLVSFVEINAAKATAFC